MLCEIALGLDECLGEGSADVCAQSGVNIASTEMI